MAATEEWLSFVLNEGAPGYETATDHRRRVLCCRPTRTGGVLADYEAVAAPHRRVVGAARISTPRDCARGATSFPPETPGQCGR
ncbi:MAG: hypothetical protein R2705_09455 [Ilumatobacteraceae bacterium]